MSESLLQGLTRRLGTWDPLRRSELVSSYFHLCRVQKFIFNDLYQELYFKIVEE